MLTLLLATLVLAASGFLLRRKLDPLSPATNAPGDAAAARAIRPESNSTAPVTIDTATPDAANAGELLRVAGPPAVPAGSGYEESWVSKSTSAGVEDGDRGRSATAGPKGPRCLPGTAGGLSQASIPTTCRCAPNAAASISVIIPARNEESNLPRLLESLAEQQPRPLEVIVVDDHSTDGTAEVARAFGANVLAAAPLPEGWRGKPWACHQGAQAARGHRFLFLDADTWFEPGGLARTLAAIPHGTLSIGPFHAVRERYEDLSLFFNLAMVIGTVPQGLFGQFLRVDREAYERCGGHAAVRGRILENVHWAENLHAAGLPLRSVVGRGVFACRLYPDGIGSLVRGWTKGFAAGAGRTPRGTMALMVAWLTGLALAPLGLALSGAAPEWGILYLLCAVQVAWMAAKVGAFRISTALAYPVPLLFFFAVFAWSAHRSGRSVRWKGREIRAD